MARAADASGLLHRWGVLLGVFSAVPLLVGCAALPSREAQSPVPAVFRLTAPSAKRVSVVGNFNGWDPQAHPLRGPDRFGVWSLSVPLPPGHYRYLFVVDGVRWVMDPGALASDADGFGGRSSLLFHGR